MPLSREVRRLQRAWQNETAWPKRLDWVEIENIRGWTGTQRIKFPFPIVAISGENGSGKSTILQACATSYQRYESTGSVKQKGTKYAADLFPDTYWDEITNAAIRFGYTEGNVSKDGSLRKHEARWNGNRERPIRPVEFLDLSRIVPLGGRTGYTKIAKSNHTEGGAKPFDEARLARLSNILGHKYASARMATADVDPERPIPILQREKSYSGYHQGQGETTVAELIQTDLPKYSLVLIDEIESSLHPSAQRRLIRDLATMARDRELQIILTTHSPYVLEELPPEARLQIFEQDGERQIMIGVSPEFALSKMDEVLHPECEIYVEDEAAKALLLEMLSQRDPDLASRLLVTPFGAASVGYQLGQMVAHRRFPRSVGVFLDGDCAPGDGCARLPGDEAPECVVFEALSAKNWADLWVRLLRDSGAIADACSASMLLPDHHDWIGEAAKRLVVSPTVLWHAMCAEWVRKCLDQGDYDTIRAYIEDRIAERR